MNPILYNLLAGYVKFKDANGVDREQVLIYPPRKFAELFKWQRITNPRLRGLAKQCKMLGIDFEISTSLNEPFVFRLHDLRLVNNYRELSKLGDRHDTTI